MCALVSAGARGRRARRRRRRASTATPAASTRRTRWRCSSRASSGPRRARCSWSARRAQWRLCRLPIQWAGGAAAIESSAPRGAGPIGTAPRGVDPAHFAGLRARDAVRRSAPARRVVLSARGRAHARTDRERERTGHRARPRRTCLCYCIIMKCAPPITYYVRVRRAWRGAPARRPARAAGRRGARGAAEPPTHPAPCIG